MLSAMQSQRVERYLGELETALANLPIADRTEVVAGVREHIEAALADREHLTDQDVDDVLRSLGDPLAIAAEAGGADGAAREASPEGWTDRNVPLVQREWWPGAVAATLFFGVFVSMFLFSFGAAFLLPVLVVGGWAMLWLSPLWTLGEKFAGTFLLPAPGLAILLVTSIATSTQSCVSSGSVGPDGTEVGSETTCVDQPASQFPVFTLLFGLSIVAAGIVAIVLYRRGRRRAEDLRGTQIFSTGA